VFEKRSHTLPLVGTQKTCAQVCPNLPLLPHRLRCVFEKLSAYAEPIRAAVYYTMQAIPVSVRIVFTKEMFNSGFNLVFFFHKFQKSRTGILENIKYPLKPIGPAIIGIGNAMMIACFAKIGHFMQRGLSP